MRKNQLVSGIYNAMQSNITVQMTLMTNKAKNMWKKYVMKQQRLLAVTLYKPDFFKYKYKI